VATVKVITASQELAAGDRHMGSHLETKTDRIMVINPVTYRGSAERSTKISFVLLRFSVEALAR
jgi:hypothetical protein